MKIYFKHWTVNKLLRHRHLAGIVADGGDQIRERIPHIGSVVDMADTLETRSSYNINNICKVLGLRLEYKPVRIVTYLNHHMTWFHPYWAVEHCKMRCSGPLHLFGSIFGWCSLPVLIVGLQMLRVLSNGMVFPRRF